MDLFGLSIVIFYFFIIKNSYRWICKITRKEQFIFLCYTIFSVVILEELINLLNLGGFGISKFLFPLLIYIYHVGLKKHDKYKGIFICLLISLLYHSTHTFIAVTISSITGDSFVTKYENFFFLVVLLLTYFAIKKLLLIFTLNLIILTKTTSIHFLRKLYLLSLLYMFYHSFQI